MRARRYLESAVQDCLRKKMALVGGPRQVGKTTFALGFLGEGADETHPAYLNWDHPQVRRAFRQGELPAGERLILLDEIHKYRHCRNTLEGLYDTEKSRRRFIVTGSARLDYCRKGGDSLAGRYRYYRLHPFSVREMVSTPSRSDLDALLKCGGVPSRFSRRTKPNCASGGGTAWRASCARICATWSRCARSASSSSLPTCCHRGSGLRSP